MENVPVREAIAIIPAKSVSRRLPGKNLKLFRGIPLFLWSVLYAKEEGFQPVVFTDSAQTRHVAEGFGAIVYPQEESQFENYEALVPAIQELKPKYIILMQATSPLRRAGAARDLYDRAINGEAESFYTCDVKKCVGHLGGKYWSGAAPRTEENTLYQADGNLWLCSADYFLSHGNYFIGEDSKPVANMTPYTMEIDTKEDFRTLEALAIARKELLVHPIRRIACVQNQRCIERDYSEFIDSCDLVVRAGKLDNIDTKRTGIRTDVVFSHTYMSWWSFSDQEKHLPELNKAALIYMDPRWEVPDTIQNYFGWPYPARQYTTSYLALEAMHKAFPEAKLYNLGTHNVKGRKDTLALTIHMLSDEHLRYDEFVRREIVIDIDEDTKEDGFVYSKVAGWDTHSPEVIRISRPVWGGNTPWAYLYLWKPRLVLSSIVSPQAAKILRWQRGHHLTVQWDNSDKIQTYTKNDDNVYVHDGNQILIEDVFQKYLGELVPSVPIYYDRFFVLGSGELASKIAARITQEHYTLLFTRELEEAIETLSAQTGEAHNYGDHPVFLYIEETNAPGYWFNFEKAYNSVTRLRMEVAPNAALLYFARSEKPESHRPEIIYSDDNFLACTYSAALSEYFYDTFEKVFKNVIKKDAE